MIVAPLSILGVWEEEFQKFAAFPYALAVLSGSSAKKLDTLRHMIGTALQVVVVNYESAWRLEKALTAWHPDLIIADEGHKIKTHNIAASKAMHRMAGRQATGSCSPVRLSPTRPLMCSASINSEPGHLREQLLCLPQPLL